jgi:hypothetical protein
MVKKNTIDGLFPLLDWILKKKGKLPVNLNLPGVFLINRWLSMTDSSIVKLVNATGNRWINKSEIGKSNIDMSKFYNVLLPKNFNKMIYIKKASRESSSEDLTTVAQMMECSTREVELYNKTLAELK